MALQVAQAGAIADRGTGGNLKNCGPTNSIDNFSIRGNALDRLDTSSYEDVTKGEDTMSQLMILPTTAIQEDLTDAIFSDLLRSLIQQRDTSAGSDLSYPPERTLNTTTGTSNRSLRGKRAAYQSQKSASATAPRVEYKGQPLVPTTASPNSTDADLVDQAAVGNERAYEMLVQRYEKQVWHFVYHHMARTDDVQDIVQFVFLQLFLFLPRLQGHLISTKSQQPLKSWLFQVARNRCHDERRKKHLLLFSDLDTAASEEESSPFEYLPDTSPLPDETVEQQDQQRLIQDAIQTLPSHFRSIVSLRYREDLTFREIGQRLHIPENTAKTYFQRARPLLRTALASLWEERCC
jgi:RNA polymerase sigma-70 factor (ECF subfamily)